MNDSLYSFQVPDNEPILDYLDGSPERIKLDAALKEVSSGTFEIPLVIGGKEIFTGNTGRLVFPHDHKHNAGLYHKAEAKHVQQAIDAAMAAHKEWSGLDWVERSLIMLRVAELISGKYRALMNATTMLGQGKNIFQAEIDSACETIDFLRYNTHFASRIYTIQPRAAKNQINRLDFRPLEGFVFAVSPFNFTAIASNLNMSPVAMGNTTVWKPATTALLSNYMLTKIFREAGVPDGVVNFVPGSGAVIGNVVMNHRQMAGLHFTGSNGTFNSLWKTVSENLPNYQSYPRLVGETGGKNYVFVHPSSDALEVAVNTFRGAFEYQGQKCSAASRLYIPKSLWGQVCEMLVSFQKEAKMGSPMDASNFINSVIDEASFDNIMGYIHHAEQAQDAKIIAGGKGDKSQGYFVEPTIIETTNPHFKTMEEEIFGPVLTVFVYEDAKLDETIDLCNSTSPYGLTGAIFGHDRVAVAQICNRLRYTAGNMYINDKPTGAVVGMQPFGGSRASGTNDKAGGEFNLLRWINPRNIKETFLPPIDYRYPYMINPKY